MRYLYAVESEAELRDYQAFSERVQPRLEAYLRFLQEEYAVEEPPRVIVWTGREAATQLLSDIPVPAYTNEYRVMLCPASSVWQDIYLRQLDGLDGPARAEIRAFYETAVNENCILSILGHELAHHSEWFLDDFADERESGIWFEEGMAEYIGRRYFLTAEEFDREAHINRLLVSLLEPQYGSYTLENFGAKTYAENYAAIFFEYWRSFLAVEALVARFGGVPAVFRSYHEWAERGREQSLETWFSLSAGQRDMSGSHAHARKTS